MIVMLNVLKLNTSAEENVLVLNHVYVQEFTNQFVEMMEKHMVMVVLLNVLELNPSAMEDVHVNHVNVPKYTNQFMEKMAKHITMNA